jgi:hypothetical protein
MTRERQETASLKTTNLSLTALEVQEQHLEPRPERGAGQVLFCTAPWSGFSERPWFSALSLFGGRQRILGVSSRKQRSGFFGAVGKRFR